MSPNKLALIIDNHIGKANQTHVPVKRMIQSFDERSNNKLTAFVPAHFDTAKAVDNEYALKTRRDICLLLSVSSGRELSEADRIKIENAARKFPDIAQGNEEDIPPWSLEYLRRSTTSPSASRYLYAQNTKSENFDGVFHVELLHGGATLLISKVQRFQGRIIHDSINISQNEFDLACDAFLRTFSYMQSPIANENIRALSLNIGERKHLAQEFKSATSNFPFSSAFGANIEGPKFVDESENQTKVAIKIKKHAP